MSLLGKQRLLNYPFFGCVLLARYTPTDDSMECLYKHPAIQPSRIPAAAPPPQVQTSGKSSSILSTLLDQLPILKLLRMHNLLHARAKPTTLTAKKPGNRHMGHPQTLILGTLRKPAEQPMRAPPGKVICGIDCSPPSFRQRAPYCRTVPPSSTRFIIGWVFHL